MKSLSRWSTLFGIAAAALVLVSGVASATPNGSASSALEISHFGSKCKLGRHFRTLAILPLSGSLAAIGQGWAISLRAAGHLINTQGGILGCNVDLKFIDDAGSPVQGVNALQGELASGTKYDLIIPGAASAESFPMLPLVGNGQAWAMSALGAGVDGSLYPTAFGAGLTQAHQADFTAIVTKAKGYTTSVAWMGLDNITGHANADELAAVYAKAGTAFHAVFTTPGAVDVTPQLQQLQGTGAQVLVLSSNGPHAPIYMQAIAKLGWSTPLLGDYNFCNDDLSSVQTLPELKRLTLICPADQVNGSAVQATNPWKQFYSGVTKLNINLSAFSLDTFAYPYEVFMYTRAVAKYAQSTDPKKMAAAAYKVNKKTQVPGWFLSDDIGYTTTDHNPQFGPNAYAIAPACLRVNGISPKSC